MKLSMMNYEDKKIAFPHMLHNREGDISKACYDLGMSRSTYRRWIDEDEEFAEICADVGEGLIDMTEGMLIKNIRKGKSSDIKLMLTTRGRNRGYGEKVEVEHTGVIAHAHGVKWYPNEPKSVAEWEDMMIEAESRRVERENEGENGSNQVLEGIIVEDESESVAITTA